MASTAKSPEDKVLQKASKQKSPTSKACTTMPTKVDTSSATFLPPLPPHELVVGLSKDPTSPGVAPGTKAGGGGVGARETTTATTKRITSPQATGSEAKSAKRTGRDAATEATRHSPKASKVTKASKAASGAAVPATNPTKRSQAGKNKSKGEAADSSPKKHDGEAAPKVHQVKASTGVLGKDNAAHAAPDTDACKKTVAEPKETDVEADAPKDAEKSGVMPEKVPPRAKRPDRRRSILLIPLSKVFRSKALRRSQRRHGAGDDSESSLSSKGQLSLIVVIMLGTFFFVFTVVLLVYYFISGPNVPITVACITDECLRAREYLNGLLNESKNPCVDFYGYVCDPWRNTSSSFHGDVVGRELTKLNESLFQDIRITQDEEKRYGIHVLRPVYRSCYRYMSEPVELGDALKEAHELLEIPQIMKAATFFDVVRYLVHQVLQIGVFTLFKALFVYESGKTQLFMSRGHSLQEKLTIPFGTKGPRTNFQDILRLWLGRDNVTEDLELLVEMDSKVSNIFHGVPSKEEHRPFQEVVSGMVTDVSPEQWLLAVKGAHRESFVFELTDDIIAEGTDVFRKAMQMVVVRGLREAAFYLATNLEAEVVYILAMRDTIAQTESAKASNCLRFTYKCLTLTWAYLAARYLAAAPSIAVLENILAGIQDAISEEGDTFTWMETTTRNKTAEALRKVSLHVIAGRRFNASIVDYNKPDVKLDEGDKFLKVLVTALKLHHSVMLSNPPTRLELLISELQFTGTVSLVSSVNYIVVPTLYQHDPYLYNYDVPDYYNYGTMGALLGIQLAEIAAVGVKDKRQSDWDTSSITKHSELLQCLLTRREQLGFPVLDPSTANKRHSALLTFSISAQLALSGLRKVFRKKSQTAKVFNDYWPEALHVFFTRFCLLWCRSSSKADPLTPRAKCILPLYNMKEFGEIYSCDAKSTGGASCST